MPKDTFVFKPFTIYQNFDDVMKVSTDSVLLGCYANVEKSRNALDIGCGTGLLALMSAYKNPSLKITAIDINNNACKCAEINIQQSAYKHQIQVIHTSVQDFTKHTSQKFDVIISNPPYFSKSLKSNKPDKNIYRHQQYLNYSELINCVNRLLQDNGSFFVLIPYYEKENFLSILNPYQLFIHSEMAVYSRKDKPHPYIFIFEIKKDIPKDIKKNNLYIHHNNNLFTSEYLEFTKDFYLFA